MRHIKLFDLFKESVKPIKIDAEVILQSIGILSSPRNEIFGTPSNLCKDTPDSKTLLPILTDMLKGGEPSEDQMELLKPLFSFIIDKKSTGDAGSGIWLDKYRKEGEKQTGVVYSEVGKAFDKRKKVRLF